MIIGIYIPCFSTSETETGSSESGGKKKQTQEGGVNREIITDLAGQQTQLLIALLYRSKRLEIESVSLFSRGVHSQYQYSESYSSTLLMSWKIHEYLSI